MADKCPVCNSDVEKPTYYDSHGTSMHSYSCPRCGNFDLQYNFSHKLPMLLNNDIKKITVLSHWIRTRYEVIAKEPPDEQFYRKTIILNEELVDTIIKRQPPNPVEQANNIIRWLGKKIEAPGEDFRLEPAKHQSIMGAITSIEFMWIIKHLIKSGILEGTLTMDPSAEVTLSFEGWQYYEELKRGAIESRKAFMAMKYGEEQLEKIVEEVFKPAVKQTGFDLLKLVDRPKAGLIDDRLRVEIQTSRFLITDLTHENAGAYWEAGYAEGLNKPVIYTCEKAKFEEHNTHFDTNHHLTILWDAEKPQESAEELKATIRATLPGEAKLKDE